MGANMHGTFTTTEKGTRAQRVLILMPCSGKKLSYAHQAFQLYQGPMWRTLANHIGRLNYRNVFVLSGKYGFIGAMEHIQPYEARLTKANADRLITRGVHMVNDHHGALGPRDGAGPPPAEVIRPYAHKDQLPYTRVICAGAGDYRRVFEAFIPQLQDAGIIARDATIDHVHGGIGEQRAQLGAWLRAANGQEDG